MSPTSEPTPPLSGTELFRQAAVLYHQGPTARIAYRRVGQGPPLVFLHGWPLWSFTFRKLLPHLTAHYECVLIDLPGGGDTEWTPDTDFTWPGQAASVRSLLDELGFDGYFLFGQDSGAMIARHLCLIDGRVRKLVMTNTEIPNHRPPYLPLYRWAAALPGAGLFTRLALSCGWFLRSRYGFGGSLARDRIDGEFRDEIIRPLVASARRAEGHRRFLRGWDWALLDTWAERHRQLRMPVLLVWGAADPTFPLARAEEMAKQFPDGRLVPVPGARLFVQEDAPVPVANAVRSFLGD